MATYTIWRGTRSLARKDDCENLEVKGEEIGATVFNVEDARIRYRVFRTDEGAIIIYNTIWNTQNGDQIGEIYEYASLAKAKKEYRLVLKKAGVI